MYDIIIIDVFIKDKKDWIQNREVVMFKGNYNFFDYKYNIEGYTGQDYTRYTQNLYLIISFATMIILLIVLRKSKNEKVKKIIRIVSIFLTLLYIGKTIWESYYDITQGGGFNYYLLPFDTCSFIIIL